MKTETLYSTKTPKITQKDKWKNEKKTAKYIVIKTPVVLEIQRAPINMKK